jgi:hypothetical protein
VRDDAKANHSRPIRAIRIGIGPARTFFERVGEIFFHKWIDMAGRRFRRALRARNDMRCVVTAIIDVAERVIENPCEL